MLDFPAILLCVVAIWLAVAGYFTTRFTFDASADTLVVQGDPDLEAYLQTAETFGGDEFLLLTFTPRDGRALAAENLAVLARLQAEIAALPGVGSVFSILDAPLLKSPPMAIEAFAEGYPTLASAGVDPALAALELTGSALFSELLITRDAGTTAMRIALSLDRELLAVDRERATLQMRQRELQALDEQLPAAGQARLAFLDAEHDRLRAIYLVERDALIKAVRGVRDRHGEWGVLHLGGVPMIAADMIDFVKRDLVSFGAAVLVLIIGALWWFFRSKRWVLLPLLCSATTVIFTTGLLGAVDKPATVVSSNFVALLAIMVISLTIHLIVQYREFEFREPGLSIAERVRDTLRAKFAPCLYNSLTTLAAFASLMASDIVPVEDFGWMMCIGIVIGFVVAFTVFPAVLLLMPAGKPPVNADRELSLTRALSLVARWRYVPVTVIALVCTLVAVVGIGRVSMDNRFLEYFGHDTDIYQGMYFVDRHLGGTVPFDVVIGFQPYESLTGVDDEDDFFADDVEEVFPERYWFTRDKLDRLASLHAYLEGREMVGKVVSLSALDHLARDLNGGEPLTGVQIAGVLGALPDTLRRELITPYADADQGLMRLSARVFESGPTFDRAALAADVRQYAEQTLGFAPGQVQVTGVMILFDNMLKQLLHSQIDTLVWLLLVVFAMFAILLRSLRYAVLGLIPNILAAGSVIGIMGYAGIPLDMMTITIAAISVGIGVDDAIHYLHRFRSELARNGGDVRLAVAFSHATIGSAMYFTSLTIMIGFSVLVLSSFVPTVLFGVLTTIAMALALLANLTLLPSLLVLVLAPPRRRLPPRSAS
jgi:predicted RND superfamily exporter protein